MSETFKIHLQGTSDTQQWLKAEGQLRKLDSAANDFLNSLKQGVGIDLGGRIVSSIAQLPQMFSSILDRGYEFNKTMAQSEGGLANILAKFMKLDAQAAKQEAAKAMAAISEWEPKAAGSLQDLTQGFMATVGAGQAAGITVEQNVELVGKFANALAALGMDASQLTQELRAIFTGNITPDAQLAKTLEITPQAVKSAKDAGTFYEFLNKQLGTLGDAANGPAVALSSMNSAIDKAAGVLAKPLFDEIIRGAEELTKALENPAIKKGLEEAGVSIGALTRTGVQLTLWAVENAPLLLRVADGAVKVGAAIAAIKLTEILAGLVLKAARWGVATIAIRDNTAALGQNAIAQNAAGSAGGGLVKGAGAAGAAGGKALGGAMVTAFKGIAGVGLQVALLAAVSVAMDAAMKYIEAEAEMAATKADASSARDKRYKPLENRVTSLSSVAVSGDQQAAAKAAGRESQAVLFREMKEQQRLIEEARQTMATAPKFPMPWEEDTFTTALIAMRDAEAELRKIQEVSDGINAALAAMDTKEGQAAALKKSTEAAAEATNNFNASLLAGKAAAGDSAAQIQLATDSVDALVKKLEEATKTKLDASTFETLLKSLEAIDKTKVDDATVKNVEKLVEAAGKLRDLKKDAAAEAKQQADEAKQVAEDALRAADEQRAKEIERLELQGRVLDAAGKSGAADDARARAEALRLQEQLVQAGLAEGDAHKQALGIVQAEIAAEREKNAVKEEGSAGPFVRGSNRAPLSAADTWGDGRDRSAMGRRSGFALDAFAETQKTPLRDTFKFPALDAFASSQRTPGAEPGATAANAGGGGADVAGAAKQAATSAAQMAAASAKADAATAAELMALRTKLDLVTAQCEQMQSQISHSNRS